MRLEQQPRPVEMDGEGLGKGQPEKSGRRKCARSSHSFGLDIEEQIEGLG